MIEELRGTVRRCIYASDDGRFCVFQIEDKESRKLACATYHGRGPYVGEQILMRGCWQKHPRFGVQFSARSMEMVKPEETEDIIHFLASGMIDGIRETMARRIVAHFGKKTMDVFENNIDALLEVPGIGPKGFEKIKKSYEMISGLKEIIMYLQSLAIPEKYAADMQKRYGENIKSVFQHEPYRMLEDIAGMTFLEVDRIAMDQGVAANDCERITAGVTYMLGLALSQGHSCVPIDSLAKNTVPKYPSIARKYFADRFQPIDIIKLNGSVELAPLVGLSDVIVDIVETGTTLRENGLEAYDYFMDFSARLICNKVSYKMKQKEMAEFMALVK